VSHDPSPEQGLEADVISREHLVRLLLEQIERTFATDGRDQALQQIAAMLRRLDQSALRALVYEQGLQDEAELSEDEDEQRW
jgi:precorrin-6B methylase 1